MTPSATLARSPGESPRALPARTPGAARPRPRQQRAAAGAGEAERLGAPARVVLLHPPVRQLRQERAAGTGAELLVVLLGEQVDGHGERGALHGHAVEGVEPVLQRERHQPPPARVQQPHLGREHALGHLAAVLGAVHVRPRAQREVVARRPAHVVDERPAGVLEQHRVLHGRAQLREDLGHAAPAAGSAR